MAQFHILKVESINKCDPHGYFSDSGRQEVNYKSPTKRSFLNECIRQIYIITGNTMPNVSHSNEYNRGLLWNTLNDIMVPPRVSAFQASIQKVKRRLFREPKSRPRKFRQPKFNDSQLSECSYFKQTRFLWGNRKIPRNYLDQARVQVHYELHCNLKRKHYDDDDDSDDDDDNINENEPKRNAVRYYTTSEGVFQVSEQVISEVCQYHGNMARNHPQRERSIEEQMKRERNTEACRLSRRAKKLEEMMVEQQYFERLISNEKVLEASIRSILYMKALMGLMVGQQDDGNVYI